MRMLLISNSFSYHEGYLDHCINEVQDILGKIKEVLFVPYASHEYDSYFSFAEERFSKIHRQLISIHNLSNKSEALRNAEAIFVGGGNTFRLLRAINNEKLLPHLNAAVKKGIVYIGASAGIVITGPTIKTTNDMPIVFPHSFDALNLLPFHINPHYIDPDPDSKIMMETRDERIRQFQEENKSIVLGLREGSLLTYKNSTLMLQGKNGCKVFPVGEKPINYPADSDLSFLFE